MKTDGAYGCITLGSSHGTGEAARLAGGDVLRHALVIGATGSGKTTLLVNVALQHAIDRGGGLVFVDGKGDDGARRRILEAAAAAGRLEDVQVVDLSREQRTGQAKPSDTFSPFANASGSAIIRIISGMMERPSGEGVFWHGRALSLVRVVAHAGAWMRDNLGINLTPSRLRRMFHLREVIDLTTRERYPDLPARIREGAIEYLHSLPGYQPEKGYKQAQTTLDQHGYQHMHLSRLLGALADEHAHVFDADIAGVDLADVHRNERILIVLLPSMDLGTDEAIFAGRIVVAMIGELVANAKEVGELDGPRSLVVLDEFSHYAPQGVERTLAQARSRGIAFVLAAQSMRPAAWDEGGVFFDHIASNTATKVLLRCEHIDPQRLAKIAPAYQPFAQSVEAASLEARMRAIAGYAALAAPDEIESVRARYRETMSQFEKGLDGDEAPIDSTQLQGLATGTGIVFRGKSRIQVSFAEPLNAPEGGIDVSPRVGIDDRAIARISQPPDVEGVTARIRRATPLPPDWLKRLADNGETLPPVADVDMVRLASSACFDAGNIKNEG